MHVQFTLPCRPFSVNAQYCRDRRYKTADAKDWESMVAQHLDEIKDLTELALEFNERGGQFRVKLTFVYPHHVFFNQQGQISAKTQDLSNCEKMLIDMIFGHRMDVNDRFICELHSRKIVGATYEIRVELELEAYC